MIIEMPRKKKYGQHEIDFNSLPQEVQSEL